MAAIITIEDLLNAGKAALIADSTLSFLGTRVTRGIGGFFNIGDPVLYQPNVVLSAMTEAPNPRGKAMIRDEHVLVTYYAYTEGWGTERGLFGDGNAKGIYEIGRLLKVFLMNNTLGGVAAQASWQGTAYPEYAQRNFETLNEVQVSILYNIRGT